MGYAYALRQKKDKKRIICLVGDQELMEGTTWESLHAIDNYKLHNLILIIDRNKSDFRSIKFHNLKKKLSVFSNKIYEINLSYQSMGIYKLNTFLTSSIQSNFSQVKVSTLNS